MLLLYIDAFSQKKLQINSHLSNIYNPRHPCRGYFVLSSHVFEKVKFSPTFCSFVPSNE